MLIVIAFLLISASPVMAEVPDEKQDTTKQASSSFVSENKRARLNEARKCVKESPGNSWNECRYNCVEVCNEVLETYARGVCNGVLIQTCCGQHPSGCK